MEQQQPVDSNGKDWRSFVGSARTRFRQVKDWCVPRAVYPRGSKSRQLAISLFYVIAALFPFLSLSCLFLATVENSSFDRTARLTVMFYTGAVLLASAVTILLVRMNKLNQARYVFSSCTTAVILAVILTTGGISKSVASSFVILFPLIFFFFFNFRAGMRATILFPPLVIGMDFLNQWLGNPIPNLTSQADETFNRMLVSATLYLIVTLGLTGLFRTIHSVQADLYGEHRELVDLVDLDDLTGIANARKFQRELQKNCDRIDETGGDLAVYYIDLNDFKPVNDTHGHAAGDELLRQVAKRLSDFCEEGDCAARLGGDEFAIILNRAIDEDVAKSLAQLIETTISVPVYYKDTLIQVSASVGHCLYPFHTRSAARILHHADQNMYSKKDKYRRGKAA